LDLRFCPFLRGILLPSNIISDIFIFSSSFRRNGPFVKSLLD
jgi:hypothetical protein